MSPAEGVKMWKDFLEPLKEHGIRLGSPAPSGAPGSKEWLHNFLDQCGEDCTVDFQVLHWYGTNATAFKDFITDYHNEFNLDNWVTEWACQNMKGPQNQCSMSDIFNF
ncbi:hypothetical protein B0H14DRAFT_204705 [Mycena olivaceomarginata]|nr:hypothetical protein B0H14DRAFT_204705 [Mycena olivaceomarginata]